MVMRRSGSPSGIFVRGVEIEVVALVRNVLAGESDDAGAVEIFDGGFLPCRAPARQLSSIAAVSPKVERGCVPTLMRSDHSAADEGEIAVIEDVGVEIGDAHAGAARAHEPVEGLFEKRLHSETALDASDFFRAFLFRWRDRTAFRCRKAAAGDCCRACRKPGSPDRRAGKFPRRNRRM